MPCPKLSQQIDLQGDIKDTALRQIGEYPTACIHTACPSTSASVRSHGIRCLCRSTRFQASFDYLIVFAP